MQNVKKFGAIPVALVALLLIVLPLQAVTELPGEKTFKSALGVDYPKTCADYETIGQGDAGAWRDEPPLPSVRDEPRAVLIGRKAYLAGGVIEEGERTESVRLFESFDLDDGGYSRLPDLPEALNHVGIATYGGDIYMVGGFTGGVNDPVSSNRAWRYDVDGRTWEEISPLKTPRAAFGLAVVGDKMYAFGGRTERVRGPGRSLTSVEVYDFATDTWSEAAPMPRGRDHFGDTVYRDRIYAVGGRPGRANAYRDFARYDPATDEWTELRDYPLPASGAELEAIGGRLVAAGGEDPGRGRLIGSTYAYDPGADRWEALPGMSRPKHGYGAVAADGRFWAFGGAECYGFQPARSVQSLRVHEQR
jgi:hypothetical protein